MKPVIICITPIKNEAWILDLFLQSTSLWADYIILSDQGSTDNSVEIARKYEKVTIIDNSSIKDFDEFHLRKPLIDAARKIEGKRIIISLDADEILTPDLGFSEWNKLKKLEEGTYITFPFYNIYPGFKKCWFHDKKSFGYVDNGKEFKTGLIHTHRLFGDYHQGENVYHTSLKVLHYQFVDWKRMESKHRWYQCFEVINYPDKSKLDIYRTYHHMYSVDKNKFILFDERWITDYKTLGVDLSNYRVEGIYWWDIKVVEYFVQYGELIFSKIDIWTINWNRIQSRWGLKMQIVVRDPRSILERLINIYLRKTQRFQYLKLVKKIDRYIKRNYGY